MMPLQTYPTHADCARCDDILTTDSTACSDTIGGMDLALDLHALCANAPEVIRRIQCPRLKIGKWILTLTLSNEFENGNVEKTNCRTPFELTQHAENDQDLCLHVCSHMIFTVTPWDSTLVSVTDHFAISSPQTAVTLLQLSYQVLIRRRLSRLGLNACSILHALYGNDARRVPYSHRMADCFRGNCSRRDERKLPI